MNKFLLFLFAATATISCSNDDFETPPATGPYIEFTMTPTSNSVGITYTGIIANIDWGDGTSLTNLQSKENENSDVIHKFASLKKMQRVKIASNNIIAISFSNDDIQQGSFSIGFCPNLKSLKMTFGDGLKSTNKATLNLSDCHQLTKFNSYNTQYTSFSFPYTNSLEDLNIATEGNLQTLILDSQNKLKKLSLSDIHPSKLSLPKNGILEELALTRVNNLYTLNLNGNDNIKLLTVKTCSTTDINVRSLNKLEQLNCYQNSLKTLDTSKNTNLTILNCANNKLTQLDISNNTKLTKLVCSNNEFSENALNNVFKKLPTSISAIKPTISIGNNPGSTTCDKTIAENKGWEVWEGWEE